MNSSLHLKGKSCGTASNPEVLRGNWQNRIARRCEFDTGSDTANLFFKTVGLDFLGTSCGFLSFVLRMPSSLQTTAKAQGFAKYPSGCHLGYT